MISSELKWTDGTEFFFPLEKRHRRYWWAINIFFIPLLVPFFIFPESELYVKIISVVVILVVYLISWLAGLNESAFLKMRKKTDCFFLKCTWCSSYYCQEIWKELARYFEKEDIKYSLSFSNFMMLFPDTSDIIAKEKGFRISQYGPLETGDDKKVIWLAFGVISPNKLEVSDLAFLKKEIAKHVAEIHRNNPFCQLCSGGAKDTCYGGPFEAKNRGQQFYAKLLLFIDPYTDKETLEFLVKRKKTSEEPLTMKQIKELKEIPSINEKYRILFGYKGGKP